MTKLEEFINQEIQRSLARPASHLEFIEAEAILRAFVRLVRERSKELGYESLATRGNAFNEIVKEFELEDTPTAGE